MGGWGGGVADIAMASQIASISKENVDYYAERLTASSYAIGKEIEGLSTTKQNSIATRLYQPPGPQTWSMAALIMLNAMAFYDELAGTHPSINAKTIMELSGKFTLTQDSLLKAWKSVLNTNYHPIFKVAIDLLSHMDSETAGNIISHLVSLTSEIRAVRLTHSSDLYGLVLQKLLVDRRRLASYYTLPESAALMASLVLPTLDNPLWQDSNKITNMKVGDLACGTGMLLATLYKQIVVRHELQGKSGKKLHEKMLGNSVIGLDVLPSAAHMTVSALAGVYPHQTIRQTRVHVMPIGRHGPDRGLRLGSLDLIDDESATLFESSRQITGSGEVGVMHHNITNESLDLIVMNPPFTRAGKNPGKGIPQFAMFGFSKNDQFKMRDLAAKKFKNTCADGKAGIASFFVAICHNKLKPGGTMALILPNTLSMGSSWKKVRQLLGNQYDIKIISIAKPRMTKKDVAFSADTSTGEILLLARKHYSTDVPVTNIRYISLLKRPKSILEGLQVGNAIQNISNVHHLDDGYGGTSIMIGNRRQGYIIDGKIEDIWPLTNIVSPSLIYSADLFFGNTNDRNLASADRIHSQSQSHSHHIPFTNLEKICKLGPNSALFDVSAVRGPFRRHKLTNVNQLPPYHALWNNDSKLQKTLHVKPDTRLEVKPGSSKNHVSNLWSTASHLHINLDPNYTSQALLAAFVETKTVGGRAWPSLSLNFDMGKAFGVWYNSTLGIFSYWRVASRQQLGRGMLKISGAAKIRVPDFNEEQMQKPLVSLSNGFKKFSNKPLRPISKLSNDPVRHSLDDIVLKSLGLHTHVTGHELFKFVKNTYSVNIERLRCLLSHEPSIAGVKPTKKSTKTNEIEETLD